MNIEPTVTGDSLPPTRAWRVKVSLAAGLVAGLFVVALYARQRPDVISDWDPTWVATKALLRGESPYAAIQVPPWPNWLPPNRCAVRSSASTSASDPTESPST